MGAANIEEIILPDGLTSVGIGAFHRMPRLRRIVVPERISVVPRDLFERCEALEEVTFRGQIVRMEAGCFQKCRSLRRIQFAQTPGEDGTLRTPPTLESIGDNAFESCDLLRRVVLNAGLRSVGSRAFAGCENLDVVSGPAETRYNESFVQGCSRNLRLFLPEEVDASLRGRYGLADADGFIRDDSRLVGYVPSGKPVVEIPEGIKTIGIGALDGLRKLEQVEIRWPQTLQRIEANEALSEPHVVSHIPEGFTKTGHKLTQYELELMQHVWKDSMTEETFAAVYLASTDEAAHWAATTAPDPGIFARQILAAAGPKPRQRARVRLAQFFTEYADQIPKKLKDELQTVLSRGAVLPDKTRHAYREIFLDILLKRFGLDPDDPAFSQVRARSQHSKTPHMVSTLTVKSALVPYLLQGSHIDRTDLRLAKEQAGFIRAAEAQAVKMDPESLAGAIGQLHAARRDLPELAYAFARFALDDQLAALFAQTDALDWSAGARYTTSLMMLVRAGAMLSDRGTARELILEAPRWTQLRERYRQLHPGQHILLPEDLLDLLHGGSLFTAAGTELILTVGDDFCLEIQDRNSHKVWKLMPKKLPITKREAADLKLCVEAGRNWIETVDDQVEEELFERYITGEPVNVVWLKAILSQPVLRKALGQIVFEQDSVTFVFRNGAAEDMEGNAVSLDNMSGIRVAHALETDPAVMEAWRDAFAKNKWTARFQQLEEPRYALSEIDRDRFDGYQVSLSSISDIHSRRFMFDMVKQLSSSLPDGSVARIAGGRYQSDLFLGKIYLKGIDRRRNRLLFHFDQLTALSRVRKGDMTVIPYYALAGTAKLNNALREVVGKEKTELAAALLAIKESRRQKTGKKTRLSSEFAL